LITGPAGTGKSFIALARGLRLLHDHEVEQIIIIRSAVPTRDIGFLPGTLDEKIDAYAEPYIGLLKQLSPRLGYREMVSKKMLHFASTSFLRGLTFDNAFILVDEFQNCNGHELETAFTRVGDGTHLVLCGDSAQSDLTGKEAEEHEDKIRTLSMMDCVATFAFDVEDVVRSEFVKAYFKAKQEALEPPVRLWGNRTG
jgi:phosphate starvation-inducible protein PhoH